MAVPGVQLTKMSPMKYTSTQSSSHHVQLPGSRSMANPVRAGTRMATYSKATTCTMSHLFR